MDSGERKMKITGEQPRISLALLHFKKQKQTNNVKATLYGDVRITMQYNFINKCSLSIVFIFL